MRSRSGGARRRGSEQLPADERAGAENRGACGKGCANRPAEALLMTAVSERNSALFSVLSAFYMGFPGFKLRLRFVPKRSAPANGAENGDWLTMPSHIIPNTRAIFCPALLIRTGGAVYNTNISD